MGEKILAVRGVRKEFFRKSRESAGNFDAISQVNLDIHEGDLIACMGRSGSGKTTLLNIMAGLLAPTEGTVTLGDQSLYALSDAELSKLRNAAFGVVPQGQTGVHSLTLLENVMLPFALYGRSGDVSERALQLLDELGLAKLSESYPRELSGGEMRRMSIARALACEPKVLFADEPTADLDDAGTADVLRVLQQAADRGTAVFMVTHDHDAESCATRIVRISEGMLTESPEALRGD